MALLQLTTDTGAVSVSTVPGSGFIVRAENGEPVAASCIQKQADVVTTGQVTLSPLNTVYQVKPTAAITLSLDTTAIAAATARFQLLLDFTDAAQTVTLPNNFTWNGTAPDLSGKGIHIIDTVSISVGGVPGFVANYRGMLEKPINMDEGLVVYINGEFQKDRYLTGVVDTALTFYSEEPTEGIAEGTTYAVYVKPGVVLSKITAVNHGMYYDDTSTVYIAGGTVAQLVGDFHGSVVVSDGYAGLITLEDDNGFERSASIRVTGGSISTLRPSAAGRSVMSGGVVDNLYNNGVLEMIPVNATFTMTGGTINTAYISTPEDAGDSTFNQSGGLCSSIILQIDQAWESNSATANITGGTVGALSTNIDSSVFDYSNAVSYNANLTSCRVGTVTFPVLYGEYADEGGGLGNNGPGVATLNLKLNSNVICDTLDVTADSSALPPEPVEILIGPGCTVGLSQNTQQSITLGAITLNIDATAVVTNL